MATTPSTYHPKTCTSAAERWYGRAKTRDENHTKQERGGVCAVEDPRRVAQRLERLGAAVAREQTARERFAESAGRPGAGSLLRLIGRERVLGNPDFQGIGFLESALAVARFVCRVQIRGGLGNPLGYGTGFMVSPRLMLTNHHVLENANLARPSLAEFDYQLDRFGRMLPVESFQLDPGAFFHADEKLDYALVAVRETSDAGAPLANYGWVKLIGEQGKALLGDPVNIIQHPRGEPKQLVLRSNKLLDLLDHFAHYETDTEPGSSGSPVFNDQWEVLALHHSGVPRTEGGKLIAKNGSPWKPEMGDDQIDWVANEGVRVSSLVAAFQALALQPHEVALRDSMLNDEPPHPLEVADRARAASRTGVALRGGRASPVVTAGHGLRGATVDSDGAGGSDSEPVADQPRAHAGRASMVSAGSGAGAASWTVPLTVRLSFGDQGDASASIAGTADTGSARSSRTADSGADTSEAVAIDPDYAARRGYDARFLVPKGAAGGAGGTGGTGGAGGHAREIPLPRLSAAQLRKAAKLTSPVAGRDPCLLDYHHFSVVMNRARRLAYYTAVNIDGKRHFQIKREQDRWYFDPRIERSAQAGEEVYKANPLDRGHLVRRLDPAWGASAKTAKFANDDTFHFTNCSPQHAEFNQGDTLWAGLEDYILQNARTEDLKVTVFTGPVFRSSDPLYRGIRLPTEYWKVVAIGVAGGKLSATAYVVSQSEQLEDLEEFAFGAYRTFQVKVSEIEARTGLDFGTLRRHDPLAAAAAGGGPEEAAGTGQRELFDPSQIVL